MHHLSATIGLLSTIGLMPATGIAFAAVASALVTPCGAQTIVNTISHSGSFAGGVAFDPVRNEVIVVDSAADTVTFYDRVTGSQVAQVPAPDGLVVGAAVDPATGRVWTVSETETVHEIDRSGTIRSSFSTTPTITDASAIALDPAAGTVWVSNDSANIVAEFLPAGTPTGAQFAPATSTDGDGLAYDPYRRQFLLGEDSLNAILVVDRTGALVTSYTLTAQSPEGLAVDTITGSVFIANGLILQTVDEVSGIVPAAPAAAVTRYGTPCGAKLAMSDALADDGTSRVGGWLGYESLVPPGNLAALSVGFAQANVPLSAFVQSPCTGYAQPMAFALFGLTNSDGRFGIRLDLPPGFAGLRFVAWGADLDPVGLTIPAASDGLQVIIQ